MSIVPPTMRGKPRWSVSGASVLSPALIAGLPQSKAWVKVGPPLSCSGPSLSIATVRLHSALRPGGTPGSRSRAGDGIGRDRAVIQHHAARIIKDTAPSAAVGGDVAAHGAVFQDHGAHEIDHATAVTRAPAGSRGQIAAHGAPVQ